MKVSDLLCSEYVVIVYLFMYYYVTFSVLLCGVAVWCIMYFWVITIICLFILVICFIVLIMILYLLIMNRGKLIFKLALFVYLFFSNDV